MQKLDTVFIDMDNTLVKFNEGFAKTFQYLYREPLNISWDSYDVCANTNFTQSEKDRVYRSIFNTPNFWLILKPYEGAIEVIQELNNKYKVFILTKPYNRDNMQCTREKLLWLESYLPFINLTEQVIFMSPKGLLDKENHILIDDHVKNLKEWQKGFSIRFNQEYNLEYLDVNAQAESWEEVGYIFEEIELVQ